MAADIQHAPLQALLSFLEDMHNTVTIVRRLVENGRPVDLAGLDRQIGLLCAKALDLPVEQGRSLRPGLIRLLAEVDAVSVILASQATPP